MALIGLPIHATVVSGDKARIMHFSTPTGLFGLVYDELSGEVQSTCGIKPRALRDLSWAPHITKP